MKQLLAAFFSLAFLCAPALAEPDDGPQKPSLSQESLDRVIKPYIDELADISLRVTSLDHKEFYKNWEAFDHVAEKRIKITDLTETQLHGFYLYQADSLHSHIIFTWNVWTQTSRQLAVMLVKEDDPNKEMKILRNKKTSELIKAKADQLQLVHKRLAVKREYWIDAFIQFVKDNEELKDRETLLKELDKYRETVVEEHDRLHLVDRPEDETEGR